MGSGSAVIFRDQGSGCTIFVGSGMKTGHAGIKVQKFAYKKGISDENIPRYHPKYYGFSTYREKLKAVSQQVSQRYREIVRCCQSLDLVKHRN